MENKELKKYPPSYYKKKYDSIFASLYKIKNSNIIVSDKTSSTIILFKGFDNIEKLEDKIDEICMEILNKINEELENLNTFDIQYKIDYLDYLINIMDKELLFQSIEFDQWNRTNFNDVVEEFRISIVKKEFSQNIYNTQNAKIDIRTGFLGIMSDSDSIERYDAFVREWYFCIKKIYCEIKDLYDAYLIEDADISRISSGVKQKIKLNLSIPQIAYLVECIGEHFEVKFQKHVRSFFSENFESKECTNITEEKLDKALEKDKGETRVKVAKFWYDYFVKYRNKAFEEKGA